MVRIVHALLRRFMYTFLLQTYRVFVVWNRRWQAIVFPCLLFMGTCGKSSQPRSTLTSLG